MAQAMRCWLANTANDVKKYAIRPICPVKEKRARISSTRDDLEESEHGATFVPGGQALQFRSRRQARWRHDLTGQAQLFKQPNQPPAQIDLAGIKAQAGRPGEGMVV